MIYWLLKTLWLKKLSVLASTTGVAVAFTLVIIIDAAFVGESNQIVAYIRNMNADVWVMQKGVSNMHMASTFIWDWKQKSIAQVPGVKKTTPILYANTIVKTQKHDWFTYVLGLKPQHNRAGPWSIHSGKSMPEEKEIILPHVISRIANIQLGDQAQIADKQFTIVGFSNGTFSMANSVVFVHNKDLENLLNLHNTVSFILVDADHGQDSTELAHRIENTVDKVSALSHEQFIENDFQLAMLMGVEIIFFMSVIGSALASLIIAFTIYSMVISRQRELAISKALGFSNTSIYVAMLLQSFLLTGLAFLITLLICSSLLPLLSYFNPMLTLQVSFSALLKLGLISIAIAILATMAPAYMAAKLDPVTAFKV